MILVEPQTASAQDVCIRIGRNCKIGRRTQIGSGGSSRLTIGDYVRCHNNCVFLGNVQIYSNSILSANVFVSSGDHHFRWAPELLINDQDTLRNASKSITSTPTNIIEEDVWIGWGVVVRSGITIGRGAVIGANSVVTRDVAPYTVVAGAPARQVGLRMQFSPPTELDPTRDSCLPYFYRGFHHRMRDRNVSAAEGHILHEDECIVMLPVCDEADIQLAAGYGGNLLSVTVHDNAVSFHLSSDKTRITVCLQGKTTSEVRVCERNEGVPVRLSWSPAGAGVRYGIRKIICRPSIRIPPQ